MEDAYAIASGGGGNNKFRFELSIGRCRIRCAQGHSAGGGARADCLPVETDVQYLVHGTSLEAAHQIAQNGLSRCRRMHIHFYERDRKWNVLDGHNMRCGSDVAIVISDRQCVDGGLVFYRSANNVVLSEGANGVIGVQYFRCIYRLHRGPNRKRSELRHMEGRIDSPDDEGAIDTHKLCLRERTRMQKCIMQQLQRVWRVSCAPQYLKSTLVHQPWKKLRA